MSQDEHPPAAKLTPVDPVVNGSPPTSSCLRAADQLAAREASRTLFAGRDVKHCPESWAWYESGRRRAGGIAPVIIFGLLATERRVLEMVVRGRPLAEALGELTRAIEKLAPGMLASVLELDPGGEHLSHGAAPGFPGRNRHAIDGTRIGPNVGSCGTAAFERRVVIAADIATDPRWASVTELALQHELRACWSTPIFATDGRVLGTFALYYRQPRAPGAEDLDLIDGAAHMASVVMERSQMDAQRETLIEDLSRAVRFSEMFTGVLGYDLRNPLGAISVAAGMIRRNPTADTSAARGADRILSSAARMTG